MRRGYYSGIKTPRTIHFGVPAIVEPGRTADFYFPALTRLLVLISKREWLVPFSPVATAPRRSPPPLCECRIDGIACVPSIIYLPIAGDLAPSRPAERPSLLTRNLGDRSPR